MKLELHLHVWVHELPNDEMAVALIQIKDQGEAIMDAVQDVFERLKKVAPPPAEDPEPVVSPLEDV